MEPVIVVLFLMKTVVAVSFASAARSILEISASLNSNIYVLLQ